MNTIQPVTKVIFALEEITKLTRHNESCLSGLYTVDATIDSEWKRCQELHQKNIPAIINNMEIARTLLETIKNCGVSVSDCLVDELHKSCPITDGFRVAEDCYELSKRRINRAKSDLLKAATYDDSFDYIPDGAYSSVNKDGAPVVVVKNCPIVGNRTGKPTQT